MKNSRSVILYFLISLLLVAPTLSADDKPISIGALFSLSSWGAEGGQAELNGTVMAIEEINLQGGVNGRPLRLIIEDNNSDLRASVSAFRKLMSVDRVPLVLGPNWAEFVDVVAPLASANQVPVITASGYKERQLRKDPWVFVLWPPPAVATKVLADEIIRKEIRKVSVLVSENAYYEGLLSALRTQFEAGGVEIVEEMNFAPGTSDFRAAISRVSRNSSDAVLPFLMESGELGAFLRQRLEMNMTLPLYGPNTLALDRVVQEDLSLANGLVYFDYVSPGGEEFAAKYRKKFNEEPGFGSAKAYDGTFLAAEALKKCGEERACIRDFLRKVKHDGVSGIVEFDERGVIRDTSANTRLFTVVEGEIMEKLSGQEPA